MTGAIDDLRADVERVIAEHEMTVIFVYGRCACGWGGSTPAHAAHVSERVMAMLAEEWGITEQWGLRYLNLQSEPVYISDTDRANAEAAWHEGDVIVSRLTTRWTTDDTAREGDKG